MDNNFQRKREVSNSSPPTGGEPSPPFFGVLSFLLVTLYGGFYSAWDSRLRILVVFWGSYTPMIFLARRFPSLEEEKACSVVVVTLVVSGARSDIRVWVVSWCPLVERGLSNEQLPTDRLISRAFEEAWYGHAFFLGAHMREYSFFIGSRVLI